ncbi:MAG: type II secretion system protein GspG [Proteobacteria bacterium]|nr:type II secretion system protein GspG [Pseudomonadota bacterium]
MFKNIQQALANAQQNKALRKGMTLIEIMIVVTLMVAIMGLVGYSVIGQSDKANIKIANTQLIQFKESCKMYRIQYKKFPENLEALVNTPDGISLVDEVPEDPWGNQYNFEKSGNKIKIYSSGPDALPNTEDDIVENI